MTAQDEFRAHAERVLEPGLARSRRRVLIVGRIMVLAYLGWCIAVWSIQTSLVFPRSMAGAGLPEATIPQSVERHWITTAEGDRVEAWYFAATAAWGDEAGAGPAARRPAVIFCHGNAELIDDQLATVERWQARGFGVLLPEYRGYGRSGGTPSEQGIGVDMIAFHDWLAGRPDVDTAKIVLHGRSLGTGIAAQLAAARPPAGMVLESPFKSVASFAAGYGLPSFLVRHPFRTDRVLPKLKCPIAILHSADDEIIPVSHGRALHALSPGSTFQVLSGSHNGDLGAQPAYWQAVDALLAKAGIGVTPVKP